MLKNEVWKIFEATDFPGKWNYSDTDREHRWKDAIVELITQGKLDKDRVVDLCFKALDRTESDHRLRWFVRLLERLPLNAKEKERYFQRFLGLALHPEPTPRTFGLQYFEEGFKSGKITDSDALLYLAVVLRESSKAKAKKGLATLEKIFKRSPDLSSQILPLFIDCLGHEQGEVQQSAADFLLSHADMLDSGQKKKIEQVAESSEPSVKQSVAPLLSAKPSATAIPDKKKPTKTATKNPLAVDVRIPEPILPIQTVEELVDTVLRYLAKQDDAEELERIIDGIARLHNERDEHFDKRIKPIRKKYHSGYGYYIGDLITCWCTHRILENGKFVTYDKKDELYEYMGRRKEIPSNGKTYGTVIDARTNFVLKQMDQFKPVRLLSTPTHRSFIIDPKILVERIQSVDDEMNDSNRQDQLLAILRCGKWNAGEAVAMLRKIKAKGNRKEYIEAVRYALGDAVEIGPTASYWAVASQVRDPESKDQALLKKHPQLGPGLSSPPESKSLLAFHKGGDHVYQYTPGFVTVWKDTVTIPKPGQDYPTATLYLQGERGLWNSLVLGVFLSVWPTNIRLFYHKMAGVVAGRLHSKSSESQGVYPFIVMLNRSEPIGVEGALLLVAGLTVVNANVSGAAVDAMIQTISQDRVDVEETINGCRELLRFLDDAKRNKQIVELTVKSNRWIKPFKTVSQESPKHAMFIRDLTETILPGISERDLGAFVELLYELCLATEKKISRETAGFLEQAKPSGKAAKLVKKLLEL